MLFRRAVGVCLLAGIASFSGCERPVEPEFVASAAVGKLSPELQTALQKELVDKTGTFAHPKLIGDDEKANLAKGQAVYEQRCVQCHGDQWRRERTRCSFPLPQATRLPAGTLQIHVDSVRSPPGSQRPGANDPIGRTRDLHAGVPLAAG